MAARKTPPKRPTKAKPELTLKKAKELIESFIKLCDEGQITLECGDAHKLDKEMRIVSGKQKKYLECRLELILADFELPIGSDPEDCSSYNIVVTDVNGKVLFDDIPEDCTLLEQDHI